MIEVVGLAARYGVTHSPRHISGPAKRICLAPMSIEIPDGDIPLLIGHDDDRRIGRVLGAFAHDRYGLAIVAEVRDGVLLPGLGLSIGLRWDHYAETLEDLEDGIVATVTRGRLKEVSVVRSPACRDARIGWWRPAVRYSTIVRSWVEADPQIMKEAA